MHIKRIWPLVLAVALVACAHHVPIPNRIPNPAIGHEAQR